MRLLLLEETFAIYRLPADAPVPAWATADSFHSITRTPEELSILCRQGAAPAATAPAETPLEPDWRCVRVAGTLDFSLVGVLASLLAPLAEAGISTLAVSTFDTDYVLVKQRDLARAREAWRAAGHVL